MKNQNYTAFVNAVLEWADGKGLLNPELKEKTLVKMISVNFFLSLSDFDTEIIDKRLKVTQEFTQNISKLLILTICFSKQTNPDYNFANLLIYLEKQNYYKHLPFALIQNRRADSKFDLLSIWREFESIKKKSPNLYNFLT